MADTDIVAWASTQVNYLLPGLEGQPLQEAVKYSLTLKPEDTERHWRSLLGSSPQVESFIKQLRVRRQQTLQTQIHTPKPMVPSNSRDIFLSQTSRTPSPSKVLRITNTGPRLKGHGKMTSDLGKPKQKPPPVNPVVRAAEENRALTELEEIDLALQSLATPSRKRVPCGCFASLHEVYPLAPNCLTCGRIICVQEGIGPCFFCGEELVSEAAREEVARELRIERGIVKTRAANEKVKKVKAGESRQRAWATKVGGQDFVLTQTGESDGSAHSSGYVTPAYVEAERRRDELLEFDRTFASRTTIIDQQAEYTPQSTFHDGYSTPQERATALRRLQQIEAEQEASERARRANILDIDLRTGKSTLRTANAVDLLPQQLDTLPSIDEPSENAAAKVEIINGFAKPTFIERE